MGENPKSRGYSHVINKKKYKSYSKAIPQSKKEAIQKAKLPKLASNWDRYSNEDPNDELIGRDYADLISMPVTIGGHFKNTCDFEWDCDDLQNVDDSALFALDMVKLEQNISTFPFYERIGIDKEQFSENQLRMMSSIAKSNVKKFKDMGNDDLPVEQNDIKEVTNEISNEEHIETDSCTTTESFIHHAINDLDDLQIENQVAHANKEKSSEHADLENWLDNVLNE